MEMGEVDGGTSAPNVIFEETVILPAAAPGVGESSPLRDSRVVFHLPAGKASVSAALEHLFGFGYIKAAT